MSFATYLLRCADGSYYVGHTDDLDGRLAQHRSGLVPGYTATRLPVELLWHESLPDRDQAFALERQIKGWSRGKKEGARARRPGGTEGSCETSGPSRRRFDGLSGSSG